MDTLETQLKSLLARTQKRRADYERHHHSYRRWAFAWRLAIGLLGAAGTVLLGLDVSGLGADDARQVQTLFKNTALVAAAMVTFLSMLESYRDDRSNYVRMATTFKAFRRLEFEIEQALSGSPTEAEVARLAGAFLEIQREHDLDWETQRRSQGKAPDQGQDPNPKAG